MRALWGNFREISESEHFGVISENEHFWDISEKVTKTSTFGTFPRKFRKRALFMGDHGRLSFDHVAAKKSRGYYCPPEEVEVLYISEAWRSDSDVGPGTMEGGQ